MRKSAWASTCTNPRRIPGHQRHRFPRKRRRPGGHGPDGPSGGRLRVSLGASPPKLRGLSHREWGDAAGIKAVLLETPNASHGRLKGKPSEALVVEGKDANYERAARLGRLFVPFGPEGHPAQGAGGPPPGRRPGLAKKPGRARSGTSRDDRRTPARGGNPGPRCRGIPSIKSDGDFAPGPDPVYLLDVSARGAIYSRSPRRD